MCDEFADIGGGEDITPEFDSEPIDMSMEEPTEIYEEEELPLEDEEIYEEEELPLDDEEVYEEEELPLDDEEVYEEEELPLDDEEVYEEEELPLEDEEVYEEEELPLDDEEVYEEEELPLEDEEVYEEEELPLEDEEVYEEEELPLEDEEVYEEEELPLEDEEIYEEEELPLDDEEVYEEEELPLEDDEVYEKETVEEEPVDDEIVENETIEEEPADEEIVEDETIEEEPVDEEFVEDETIEEEPADEEIIEDETIEDEPVDEEIVEDETIEEEPANDEIVDDETVEEEPADEEIVEDETIEEEPADEEIVEDETTEEEPADEEIVEDETIEEEPADEEIVEDETIEEEPADEEIVEDDEIVDEEEYVSVDDTPPIDEEVDDEATFELEDEEAVRDSNEDGEAKDSETINEGDETDNDKQENAQDNTSFYGTDEENGNVTYDFVPEDDESFLKRNQHRDTDDVENSVDNQSDVPSGGEAVEVSGDNGGSGGYIPESDFKNNPPEPATAIKIPPDPPEFATDNKIPPPSDTDIISNDSIEKFEKEGFLTNDGEKITYKEAVYRVTNKAEDYLKQLSKDESKKIDDEKIKKITDDIRTELYRQEQEARERSIGDHGIRHLYGNFERSEKYLDSRPDANAEHKLAALISQVYHDEGYTIDHLDYENDHSKEGETAVDKSGTLHGGVDKGHDYASRKAVWDGKKDDLFDGVFSKDTLDSIDIAIGEHNSKYNEVKDPKDSNYKYKLKPTDEGYDEEKAPKPINVVDDAIVSAVHCSDKIALSEREKLPELLAKDPKLFELAEMMNSTYGYISDKENEKLGFCKIIKEGEKEKTVLTPEGENFMNHYHQIINDYIDSKDYSDVYIGDDERRMKYKTKDEYQKSKDYENALAEYKESLKTAVYKDFGLNSGKFNNKMNYVYTPSDCFKYNVDDKCNEITIYKIDYGPDDNVADSKQQYGQIEKMLEDFGASENDVEKVLAKVKSENRTEFKTDGLNIIIDTKTAESIRSEETMRFQVNNDLVEMNKSIEMGRKEWSNLEKDFSDFIENTSDEDISYRDYLRACQEMGAVPLKKESFFDDASKEERKNIYQGLGVRSRAINKAKDILKRGNSK